MPEELLETQPRSLVGPAPPLRQVVLVLDEQTYHEAIYVDGCLVNSAETLYSGMIVSAIGGQPCQLHQKTCALPWNGFASDWPQHLAELLEVE